MPQHQLGRHNSIYVRGRYVFIRVKLEDLPGEIEQLLRKLGSLDDYPEANAAVALILVGERKDFEILFVRRVEDLADPWSGQIGLPGGKREVFDENLQECVMRESLEETGINLLDGRFLGTLPPLRSKPRPELLILPFVVLLERKPVIRLNERELQSYVWIRLQRILRSESFAKVGAEEVPAYIVGETVIWGLTRRIIESFIQAEYDIQD